MALIPRDVSAPFNPGDAVQMAQFEGFACDVPTDAGMVAAVNNPPAVPTADSQRAAQLFVPALVLGRADLPTPDPVAADVQLEYQGMRQIDLLVPGMSANGGRVEVWAFQRRNPDIETWPSPAIRVNEGQVVHNRVTTSRGPHTIHHHGIEPTPMNDGAGHLSFEIDNEYTYQWRAGEAGTYFFHCHRNTVLHFEMGMYGMLIVDPPQGPGFTYVGDTLVPYGAEAIWVADDIDTRWHGLDNNPGPHNREPITDHAAGIQDCDNDGRSGFLRIDDPDNPGLHDFNPNVFAVTGHPGRFGVDNDLIAAAGVTVRRGENLLIRMLCASYCHTHWRFPSTLSGQVIAADGRALGRAPFGSYSSPIPLNSIGHQFVLSTAQRHDVLIDTSPASLGNHHVEIEFRHWMSDTRIRTVRVPITVTG